MPDDDAEEVVEIVRCPRCLRDTDGGWWGECYDCQDERWQYGSDD